MKARSPDYRIGQVVPMPLDYDERHLMQQQNLRRQTVRQDAMTNPHPALRAAARATADRNEAAKRAADPFEQARTFLRRAGFSPVAKVLGVHLVGRHRFDDRRGVMDFARSRGWGGWVA